MSEENLEKLKYQILNLINFILSKFRKFPNNTIIERI